jgi:predicted protein tyrosine phosphatase
MTRVLFICSQNRLRSPTAEQGFANRAGFEVMSAGTDVRILQMKAGPFFDRTARKP